MHLHSSPSAFITTLAPLFHDCGSFTATHSSQSLLSAPCTRVPSPFTIRASSSNQKSSKQSAPKKVGDLTFLEWLDRGKIKRPSLQISFFPEQGGRGVGATSAIKEKDIVIRVPSHLAFTVSNLDPLTNKAPQIASDEFWRRSQWSVKLALQLIQEKLAQNESLKAPYIKELPKDFTTPCHWSQEDLQALGYPHMESAVARQKAEWKDYYLDLVATSPLSNAANKISLSLFVWAMECVRSRAFSGPATVAPFLERLRLYLFVSLLATGAALTGAATNEGIITGALAAIFSIQIYDIIYPKITSVFTEVQPLQYVLCPLIDMINHTSSSKGIVEYEYLSDSFLVIADDTKKDAQLFITYGSRSNDQLLQYYGFVEQDNEHDVFVFARTTQHFARELSQVFNLSDNDIAKLSDNPNAPVYLTRQGFDEYSISQLLSIKRQSDQETYRALDIVCKMMMDRINSLAIVPKDKKVATLVQSFKQEKVKLLQAARDQLAQRAK